MAYNGLPGKGRVDWQSEQLYRLIRDLAPHIIVNNRLDLANEFADVHTPEQFQPVEWVHVDNKPVVWEACHTFSGSWGYHRDEMTWKSPEQLLHLLIDTVACGGNLLMNVGPTGRGTFDSRTRHALDVYARWMLLHDRAIYGCTQSDYAPPPGVRYTQSGDRLYVHVYVWPFKQLALPDLAEKIVYAQFLHDASEVPCKVRGSTFAFAEVEPPVGAVSLMLPVSKPEVLVPVIEVFLAPDAS